MTTLPDDTDNRDINTTELTIRVQVDPMTLFVNAIANRSSAGIALSKPLADIVQEYLDEVDDAEGDHQDTVGPDDRLKDFATYILEKYK